MEGLVNEKMFEEDFMNLDDNTSARRQNPENSTLQIDHDMILEERTDEELQSMLCSNQLFIRDLQKELETKKHNLNRLS